jgi:light-regulated signal transduction histidine kinase (bacteriophytochrome)
MSMESLSRSIRIAIEHNYLQNKIDEQTSLALKNEMQRQQLMEKLMQSNTELERFAYVASHDMQEPVRMVVNFSRILAKDYGSRLDEVGREYLKFITESADRIHDMIDDLLDYARMDNEDTGLTLVNGTSELGHVLDNLGELIKENGAQVTYDNLPVFQGNPVQFMRLMQNLIANAIKYQPPGNVPVVHVGVEDAESSWCLFVKDNGLGVDEAFAQKIFEPFRRLHSWEQIKGTGLGLAVCKKIVENHGGKIWMTSTLGQGSTFFITLPKHYIDKQMVA